MRGGVGGLLDCVAESCVRREGRFRQDPFLCAEAAARGVSGAYCEGYGACGGRRTVYASAFGEPRALAGFCEQRVERLSLSSHAQVVCYSFARICFFSSPSCFVMPARRSSSGAQGRHCAASRGRRSRTRVKESRESPRTHLPSAAREAARVCSPPHSFLHGLRVLLHLRGVRSHGGPRGRLHPHCRRRSRTLPPALRRLPNPIEDASPLPSGVFSLMRTQKTGGPR